MTTTNHIIFRIVAAIVLVVALIGLGVFVYRAGLTQGMAEVARIQPGGSGEGMPYPRPASGYFYGFGPFSFLAAIFLFLIVLWALRAIFGCMPHLYHGAYWGHPAWRGYHRMGRKEDWLQAVPPFFEEWHRKVHEEQSSDKTEEKEA